MNECLLVDRPQGKSWITKAALFKFIIEPTGLPKTNLLFCRPKNIVKWNCETGEVSTIEYKGGIDDTSSLY